MQHGITVVATTAVALALGLAAGQGGAVFAGAPALVWCVGLAFLMQWLAFVPAALQRSERFYDMVGSLTYLAVVGASLALSHGQRPLNARQLVCSALVAVWALRLGSFLVRRIRRAGKDGRFDKIKEDLGRFLVAWTLQGLWVSLTALAVLIINTRLGDSAELRWTDAVGWAVWAAGFTIELVADAQKSRFNANPANAGRFIDVGLWSRSRHPNYFGEIVLWTGLAIVGAGVFEGWEWLGLLSPVFVYVLLTRISGIPMLRARAEKRWGADADYRAYVARTRALLPIGRGR